MKVELQELKRDPARRDSLLVAPLVVRRAWPSDLAKIAVASLVAGTMIFFLATGEQDEVDGDTTMTSASASPGAAASGAALPGAASPGAAPPGAALVVPSPKPERESVVAKSRPRKRGKKARKRAKRRRRRR